ncbi:malto-oligosyltrehalose trehalohydrolase [Sinomonas cellulolyticus]|uniref:Malto-oligosyltrehalose trehalohydrolase n=2 Tax=Sinomonas cellulolyticus TaxID=2801916 RepID=A0ABS1JZR7_9MICC|nr:malto-oligosyltrehalose trehalohydrolase [Sinomonas cellulolyticus]GHG46628.1 malto-oligosyltrehalose trehalohydrolase [Sinomonas sp. KCTC 49339]
MVQGSPSAEETRLQGEAEPRPAGSVWAPVPSRVELVLGGGDAAEEHLPLEEAGNGWWRPPSSAAGRVAEALARGERYGFLLDGEGPYPDPRSRRQPDGVHALSAGFDPAAHAWADDTWAGRELPGSVIYELHVGTFTQEGTLDVAAERLPYLADLGVGFVELLPVNAFNGPRNWGYDGVLWYAVHEGYGGPAAYQRFVDAAHAAGIGVIQDVVYNHFGPSGNYAPLFGPYLVEGAATGWGAAVNLDAPGSDEVRAHILANARMWLEDYRVDGLRLDAVHAFVDRRALTLLEELQLVAEDVEAATGRRKVLVAESDLNDPRLITRRARGGYGLAGQWADDVHHAVHVALTGETAGYYADFADPEALAKVLRGGFYHDGTYSSFRGRVHGRPLDPATVRPSQLVVSSQNHDQVGNRAAGDRPSAVLGWDGLAVAAVLTLSGPFTPMLFMGEEYGATTPWQFFSSHPEPELAAATAQGRVAEFARMGWDPALVPDPQDPATFARSVLDWSQAQTPDGARLLALYRHLIAARAELPGLWSGGLDETEVLSGDSRTHEGSGSGEPGARWVSWRRPGAIVGVNLGPGPAEIPLPAGFSGRIVVATRDDCAVVSAGSGEAVRVPGVAGVVLSA